MVDRRHEDQEAARERDVRCDAGALLGDGLLGDLDEDLLAGLEQFADGWEVGRLHGAAATTAVAASATGALAVARAAGVAGTIAARSTIAAAKTISATIVSTTVATATASVTLAVAIRRRSCGVDARLIEAVGGRDFIAFSEGFVDDVLFVVGTRRGLRFLRRRSRGHR